MTVFNYEQIQEALQRYLEMQEEQRVQDNKSEDDVSNIRSVSNMIEND